MTPSCRYAISTTAIAFMLALAPSMALAPNLSGQWTITMNPDFKGRVSEEKCAIKQQGQHLSVRFGRNGAEMVGAVKDDHADWHWQDDKSQVTFTARLGQIGTTMKGTWRLRFSDGTELEGKFSATRDADRR